MAAKVDTENDKTNTIDPERLKKEVALIEEALDAKLSHRMSYVESCKPVNERVANAYEIASKAAGVPMKVLKATIKQRELQRKIEGIPEKFEDETRETFDMVCQALGSFGDTPLGGAAKDRAAKAEGKPGAAAADEPKKPRGRPKRAPSPDASPASSDLGEEAPEAASGLAGLDPRAVSETDDPTYQRGYKTGMAGGGCLVPTELTGLFQDRWHAGWHAGNAARNSAAGAENAERLGAGISPLH